MKRPECPFCGQVVERPMEIPPFHPGQVPVGRCTCGAVYACDVTGVNQGQALLEALAFACNFDLDLATELVEGLDYEEARIDHYDIVSHLVILKGFFEGRRIKGKLLFLRLSKELMEQLGPPKVPGGAYGSRAGASYGKISKSLVEGWVMNRELDTIRDTALETEGILRYIQRLLYSPEPEVRGKAAEAMGLACSVIATYKPQIVSRTLQNLFYSISDTASSNWGAFEAVSEIIARRFDLYSSYVAYLYPFLRDETRREESFKAIVRIAKDHPKNFRRLTIHFIPYLRDPSHVLRAHAIRLMGFLGASEVRKDIEELSSDQTLVSFYEGGVLRKISIAELAKEALEALG